MSVRQTILSLFGVFVLVNIFLSSGIISFVVFRIEQEIWRERRKDAVENASNTVLAFLDHIEKLLIFSVSDMVITPEHDLQRLNLLLDSDPAFIEAIHVDSYGKILNSVSRGEKVLANSFSIRQSSWFRNVTKNTVFLSPVEYSFDNIPYIISAIKTPGNTIIAARVRMSVLSQIVENIRLGTSGNIFVVDQSGYILAHPDPILTSSYNSIVKNKELSAALFSPGEIWEAEHTNQEEQAMLVTAKHIGDTGWMVFAEVSVAEAYQNSRLTWLGLILINTLLALLAMTTVARLLDGWIFAPISRLREGAEGIQAGKRNIRVPIFREDEIGNVAQSFNSMVTSLQEHEHDLLVKSEVLRQEVATRMIAQQKLEQLNVELEERVKERTAELYETNSRLKERENQFHGLVESIPAVTYQAKLANMETDWAYVSPQIEDLTGFSPAEWLAGKCWITQVYSDDLPMVKQMHARLDISIERYAYEYRIRAQKGKLIWVRDQGTIQSQGNGIFFIQGVMSDITLERERKEILIKQALHDGLTGLPNRSLFIERLEHMMDRAKRHPEIRFAVLFMDLDGFKKVNDTSGHAAGDQVLIEVGERIKSCVRGFDTVARFGGDEFVVLVEDTKEQSTILVIQRRIQAEIIRPFLIGQHEVHLEGVSIGVVLNEHFYNNPNEMIEAADAAMYQAKIERKRFPQS